VPRVRDLTALEDEVLAAMLGQEEARRETSLSCADDDGVDSLGDGYKARALKSLRFVPIRTFVCGSGPVRPLQSPQSRRAFPRS
jgi:hypothetical protein